MNPEAYKYMCGEMLKLAQEQGDKPSRLGVGARVIGATALGAGLGTAAGYGSGMLADHLLRKHTGRGIPMKYVVPASTFLGGMSGMLSDYVRHKNLEDAKRVIEDSER